VEATILIGVNGNNSIIVENVKLILNQERRIQMQGEEIQTTYREIVRLNLVSRFCDATGIDSDEIFSDLDKKVVLTETILKDMGWN
jgi:hypothetical protein